MTGEIDATGIVVVTVAATTGIVVILIGYRGEGAVRSGDGVVPSKRAMLE